MNRWITLALSAAMFMLVGHVVAEGGGATTRSEQANEKAEATTRPDTPATIIKDIVANFEAIAAVFNTITDEASAKTAVPKIEAIRANMRAVHVRAKNVKVSDDEMAKYEAEAAKVMPNVVTTLMTARMKLEEVFEKSPAVKKIIEPALEGMDKDMK